MEFTCALIGKTKKEVKFRQELYPADGSVAKVQPGFDIEEFFLEVDFGSHPAPKSVTVILNGFEHINLRCEEGSTVFRSNNLNRSHGRYESTEYLYFFQGRYQRRGNYEHASEERD